MMVKENETQRLALDARILAKLDRNRIIISNASEFINWLIDEGEKLERQGATMVNLHINEQALERLRSKRIDRSENDSSLFERLIRSVFGI